MASVTLDNGSTITSGASTNLTMGFYGQYWNSLTTAGVVPNQWNLVSAPVLPQINKINGFDFEALRQMMAVGIISKEKVLEILGLDEPTPITDSIPEVPAVLDQVIERQGKDLVRGRRLL